ncbi:hypothetical protein SISSUDRAFT_652938 [Sistotremastrum suecicum HHB10207 ss-3]|nr:hypothetical protein SISSUDRAFT_652938 [Sistotremastrum suecicum HHB10207 ss-3]
MNAVVEDGIHFEIIKDRHKPPHSIHAELLSHPLLKQGAFHYGDELSAPRTPIQVRGAQFEMLGAPDNLLSPMTVGASVTSAEAELDSMVNSPATAGFLMPIPASPFDDPLSTAPTSESELETDVTSTLSRHARLFVKMRDLDRAESTFADMKSSQRSKLIDLLVMEALCAENGTLAKAVAQLFRRLETKTICGASAFIRGFERGMQLVCQESNMGSKPIQKKKFNEMAMFLAVMLWGCAMTAASIRQLQLFANFQSTRDLLISNMEQVEAQDNLFEIWREVTPYVYTGHPSPRSVPSISSPSRYSTHEGEIEDGESLLDNDDESDDIESYYMDEDELRAPPSSSEEEVDWGYCDIHGGYCGHTHD